MLYTDHIPGWCRFPFLFPEFLDLISLHTNTVYRTRRVRNTEVKQTFRPRHIQVQRCP